MFKSGLPVTLSLLLCLVGLWPRQALACEYGYCWGAVAFGPLGSAGYAVRLNTAPDAVARAQAACGDKCVAVEVFHDSCGALAVDPDDGFQLGVGETRAKAEAAALESCRALGQYCVTRVSACSQ